MEPWEVKMFKKIIFNVCLVIMVFVCGAIYAGEKREYIIFEDNIINFAYTFPEPGLFEVNDEEVYSGAYSLRFSWRAGKGEWCGAGVAIRKPIDARTFRKKGVLVFQIKGNKGGEKINNIGLMDWGEQYTTRPFRSYLKEITNEWQKVVIPLVHFSDEAFRWDAVAKKEIPAKFNWQKIQTVIFDFGEGTGEEHTIYVDGIKIFSEGGEKFVEEKVKLPEGVISLFEDNIINFAYTYPDAGLYLVDMEVKYSGAASLRLQWKAGRGEFCVAGLAARDPIDISSYRKNGKLEFFVKGEKGTERVVAIGLMDDNGFYSKRQLSKHRMDIFPIDWEKVSIPLSKFSDNAFRWDAELRREIPGKIDWTKIKKIIFDFGEGTGEKNTVYFDQIRIIPGENIEEKEEK